MLEAADPPAACQARDGVLDSAAPHEGDPMATVTKRELDTAALEGQVRGQVIAPGDPGYEEARQVHNAMIDRRPALIVRAADIADVISVVNFAREAGAALAVRGGMHNPAGFSTVDDGVVLDLSPLKGIRVDPAEQLATVQGGCTWGDVDHATHAFGLATTGGVLSTTGMGLALGGGIGYLTRKHGLSVDNLASADVVLADGSFVTASADEQRRRRPRSRPRARSGRPPSTSSGPCPTPRR